MYNITLLEWVLISIAIGGVIIAELLNTIFERLIDVVKPRSEEYVRDMKDMMAASVTLAALVALSIGLAIFIPRII
jgi:diacylglycerol kinase